MTNTTTISVIICSFNRCDSLKNTLDSLLNQTCNKSFNYEVLMVDNNSKDMTKQIVESYIPKFNRRLRYIFEHEQGKTYALNKGIQNAKGEIIAFTDDDVIVDKEWLFNIWQCFSNYDCDGLGGKILPMWKTEPPRWLTRKFWGELALLDYGNKPFYIQKRRFQLYGANFAFRKGLFKKFGMFSTNFGPVGRDLARGEDTELFYRFLRNGCRLLYHPEVIVNHVVEKNRLNIWYFKKWNFYAAQSRYFMKNRYSLLYIIFGLAGRIISYLWCNLKRDKENMIYHEVKLFSYLGLLKAKLTNIR